MRTGKKNAVAQDKSRTTRYDDRGYLQGTVYPDDKDRLPPQSLRKEKILECAQHDTVLKQLPYCADGKDKTAHKHHEGHLYIVHGYPGEHVPLVVLLIYTKRIAPGNVFLRHIHIAIAQHPTHKGLVMSSRKSGKDGKERKDKKRIKHLPVISPDHHGQLFLPETDDTGNLLLFIAIDPQVYPGSQPIEILGHFTLRIEGFGITQVIHQLGKLARHFIRISCRLILILLPLINIFFNKESFSHLGRFSFIFTNKYSKLLLNYMALVKLDTGFNIEVEFAITPFHKRFFAWIIDIVVLLAYSLLLNKLLNSMDPEKKIWLVVLLGLPPLFYHLVCELMLNGQSVGKKAMAIKVITQDGGQPSLSQYLIRWVFRLADFPVWILPAIAFNALPWWCAIFLFGGIACVISTPHTQRIGDLIAGTIIIDTKTHTSWEDTVFTELETNYRPRFPQVMQLTDKDINTLKSIIGTVRKKGDYDLSMRIGERIKSKLRIESDQDSLDFLETLLKDYNYYSTQ